MKSVRCSRGTRTSVINACSSSEKAFAWASCAFFSLAISSASSLSIAIRSGNQVWHAKSENRAAKPT